MKDYFDVKFSELLQKSEFELPNSYECAFRIHLKKFLLKKRKDIFFVFIPKLLR